MKFQHLKKTGVLTFIFAFSTGILAPNGNAEERLKKEGIYGTRAIQEDQATPRSSPKAKLLGYTALAGLCVGGFYVGQTSYDALKNGLTLQNQPKTHTRSGQKKFTSQKKGPNGLHAHTAKKPHSFSSSLSTVEEDIESKAGNLGGQKVPDSSSLKDTKDTSTVFAKKDVVEQAEESSASGGPEHKVAASAFLGQTDSFTDEQSFPSCSFPGQALFDSQNQGGTHNNNSGKENQSVSYIKLPKRKPKVIDLSPVDEGFERKESVPNSPSKSPSIVEKKLYRGDLERVLESSLARERLESPNEVLKTPIFIINILEEVRLLPKQTTWGGMKKTEAKKHHLDKIGFFVFRELSGVDTLIQTVGCNDSEVLIAIQKLKDIEDGILPMNWAFVDQENPWGAALLLDKKGEDQMVYDMGEYVLKVAPDNGTELKKLILWQPFSGIAKVLGGYEYQNKGLAIMLEKLKQEDWSTMSEERFLAVALDLVQTVLNLQLRGIKHVDISSKNIMFRGDKPVLIGINIDDRTNPCSTDYQLFAKLLLTLSPEDKVRPIFLKICEEVRAYFEDLSRVLLEQVKSDDKIKELIEKESTKTEKELALDKVRGAFLNWFCGWVSEPESGYNYPIFGTHLDMLGLPQLGCIAQETLEKNVKSIKEQDGLEVMGKVGGALKLRFEEFKSLIEKKSDPFIKAWCEAWCRELTTEREEYSDSEEDEKKVENGNEKREAREPEARIWISVARGFKFQLKMEEAQEAPANEQE